MGALISFYYAVLSGNDLKISQCVEKKLAHNGKYLGYFVIPR